MLRKLERRTKELDEADAFYNLCDETDRLKRGKNDDSGSFRGQRYGVGNILSHVVLRICLFL